jgi:hypothetical protein
MWKSSRTCFSSISGKSHSILLEVCDHCHYLQLETQNCFKNLSIFKVWYSRLHFRFEILWRDIKSFCKDRQWWEKQVIYDFCTLWPVSCVEILYHLLLPSSPSAPNALEIFTEMHAYFTKLDVKNTTQWSCQAMYQCDCREISTATLWM